MSFTNKLSESFRILKDTYSVKDLIPTDARFLFILESPHKEELKNGIPVAGSSGKMMTKIIFGESMSEPIGLLVSSRIGRSEEQKLSQIALLNVSPIPMQAAAYSAADQAKHIKFLSILEKIRVNLSANYRDPDWNYVRDLIRTDFGIRLAALLHRELCIIPCGKFASHHYFDSGILGKKWSEISGVPHPSRNQWYQDITAIHELKETLNKAYLPSK